MLTLEEIAFWDKRISDCRDQSLIRKFYTSIGKPEKVRKIFLKEAEEDVDHELIFRETFRKGKYKPEVDDNDLLIMAQNYLLGKYEKKDYADIIVKIQYPPYQTINPFSEEDIKKMANWAILKEQEDENNLHNFKLSILNNKRYGKYITPENAKKIVTEIIFESLADGEFIKAFRIKAEYGEYFDSTSFKEWYLSGKYWGRGLMEEPRTYFIQALSSEFKPLFEDIIKGTEEIEEWQMIRNIAEFMNSSGKIALTKEMDAFVRKIGDEYLIKAYEAKKRPNVRLGAEKSATRKLVYALSHMHKFLKNGVAITMLNDFLNNSQLINEVGRNKVKHIINNRIEAALKRKHSLKVYELFYGMNLSSIEYEKKMKIPGVKKIREYSNQPDNKRLLEFMIDDIIEEYDEPEKLLSDKYDFNSDNLTFLGTGDVDNAYRFLCQMRKRRESLPEDDRLRKLIFLKMAVHVKEKYKGNGMKEIIRVYENPKNKNLIDNSQVMKLLSKVTKEGFEEGLIGGVTGYHSIAHFYSLVSSKIGEIMRDEPLLAPYYILHDFIEEKTVVARQ